MTFPFESDPLDSGRLEGSLEVANRMLTLYDQSQGGVLAPCVVLEFIDKFHVSPQYDGHLSHILLEGLKHRDGFGSGVRTRATDFVIDRLLGVDVYEAEAGIRQKEDLQKQHPEEQLWFDGAYVWTPYPTIRETIRGLDLTEKDVFYDLGSGYGRVPIYAGITAPALSKGIELIPQRVEIAARIITSLGLTNAQIIEGNVVEQDFSDGTVFYLYWPFSRATHDKVMKQLKDVAEDHPIRVIFRGGKWLDGLDWLKASPLPEQHDKLGNMTFYESV